jgi:hypothetical protein
MTTYDKYQNARSNQVYNYTYQRSARDYEVNGMKIA